MANILKVNYIKFLLHLLGKLRIISFARFWDIQAVLISNLAHRTSSFLNISSSNLYKSVHNGQ